MPLLPHWSQIALSFGHEADIIHWAKRAFKKIPAADKILCLLRAWSYEKIDSFVSTVAFVQ